MLPLGTHVAAGLAVVLTALGIWVATPPRCVPGLVQRSPTSGTSGMTRMNG
jgi:hypothetical protein